MKPINGINGYNLYGLNVPLAGLYPVIIFNLTKFDIYFEYQNYFVISIIIWLSLRLGSGCLYNFRTDHTNSSMTFVPSVNVSFRFLQSEVHV